ncbi:MAG: hypothetical protein C0596_06405 [Marinilabiliales bacterium]|nr:MAG: hypothetical protein C0596_06405 [Marinilabiliales bacterium]
MSTLCLFAQNDAKSLNQDTLISKTDLNKFYVFLSENYNNYKTIDIEDVEHLSELEKECSNILWFIHSNAEYVGQEMAIYDASTYSYTTYDIGGTNYPEIYNEIYKIHTISKKIQNEKNEKKLKRLNLKLILKLDEYLKKYRPKSL